MWFITHTETGKVFYITKDTTKVGRFETDLVLLEDKSISRLHCELLIEDDKLFVSDNASKYGSFLNGAELEKKPVEVHDGDKITFGRINNHWNVSYVQFKVVLSMIDRTKRENLSALLQEIKIEIADTLDDSCTHVTMPDKTEISRKLLFALALGKPITTIKYWENFRECMEKGEALPKFSNYIPKVAEHPDLPSASLAPNEKRTKLFAGKQFVFLSGPQIAMYEPMIKAAGGTCINLKQDKKTLKDICRKAVIVVKSNSESQSAAEDKIKSGLDKANLRMISESEIGLAIISCSTEKYCNPSKSARAMIAVSQTGLLRMTRSKEYMPGTDTCDVTVSKHVPLKDLSNPIAPSVNSNLACFMVTSITADSDQLSENQTPVAASHKEIPPTQEDDSSVSSNDPNQKRKNEQSPEMLNQPKKMKVNEPKAVPPVRNTVFDDSDDEDAAPFYNIDKSHKDVASTSKCSPKEKQQTKQKKDQPKKTPRKVSEPTASKARVASQRRLRNTEPVLSSHDEDNPFATLVDSQDNLDNRKRPASNPFDFDGAVKVVSKRAKLASKAVSVPKTEAKVLKENLAQELHDDGVYKETCTGWLSKKMLTMKMDGSEDTVDTSSMGNISSAPCSSKSESNSSFSLFDIVKTSTSLNSATSAPVRKTFKKKMNYRPQTEIIPTKVVNIYDESLNAKDL